MTQILSLVEILAIVMFGEAHILHDPTAAMAVGFVFLNRLESGDFGTTPEEVTKGFHAFQSTERSAIPEAYRTYAEIVLSEHRAGRDFTGGCTYVISHQDARTLTASVGDALWLRLQSEWTSKTRFVDGEIYALYAYKEYPVALLDNVQDFPIEP